MKSIILLTLVLSSFATSTNYTFEYTASDVILVPFGNILDLSTSLATSQYQESEDGDINLIQTIQQASVDNSQTVLYNILYFNLTNDDGSICYYNYFNNGTSPVNITTCSQINSASLANFDVGCIIFANCTQQKFSFTINLAAITYKQNILMIQNNNAINTQKSILYLAMSTNVTILSSNMWFYWSVALTCLLLLSLVLLTGVILYWSLKYRKAQRALEQLRLTEVDEETGVIRNSRQKSLIKQQ